VGQVNPIDELVAQIKAATSTRQRMGKVISIDKVSTSAWLVNVQVGADETPRPMRWVSSGHQPQVGERVIWTDDGSSLPVVTGRASSSNEAVNFGAGAVSSSGGISGGTVSDGSGNLRTAINTVDSDVSTLESWRTGTVTPALSNYESRIATLESWRTGTVTPTLASHQADLNSHSSQISTLQSQFVASDSLLNAVNNLLNAFIGTYNIHTHGGGAGPSPTV
jgi:hypothetical protein